MFELSCLRATVRCRRPVWVACGGIVDVDIHARAIGGAVKQEEEKSSDDRWPTSKQVLPERCSMLKHLTQTFVLAAALLATASISSALAQRPTASFTSSPSSPVTGKPVRFNAGTSTCPDGPCIYAWSDDGSPTRPIPPLWPLGVGRTLLFTFWEADTKYVRLVVTDVLGRTATVEHNVVVKAPESPPPAPPTNTELPSLSGVAMEGDMLTASSGIWLGSPTSYTYQWEDCNTSGSGCSSVGGATASSYRLVAGDLGHTVRVIVTASNQSGRGEATSKASAVVEPRSKGKPENCFSNPEGCGYPGPKDTGVENCSELPKSSGTKTITKAETIENTNITGYIVIDASGVTLNHDCVVFNGGEREGSAAVVLEPPATNFTISNTIVRGENTTTKSMEEAIRNNYSVAGAVAIKDRFEDCAECVHQAWTLNESYVIANGREAADEAGMAHTEVWWFSNNTISANDDTLLNPSKQTAVIFGESGGGSCVNHEKLTNSLLAGGGFMLYFCQQSSGNAGSSIEIKNNRFARRTCTTNEILDVQGRGGYECAGKPNEAENYFAAGAGTGSYFPRGGFFGVLKESEGLYNRGAGWVGNFWDDNLEEQPEQAYCLEC